MRPGVHCSAGRKLKQTRTIKRQIDKRQDSHYHTNTQCQAIKYDAAVSLSLTLCCPVMSSRYDVCRSIFNYVSLDKTWIQIMWTVEDDYRVLNIIGRNAISNTQLHIQGRSKRSGWSGHGRTNNRAGNFNFFFNLIFFPTGPIIEPVILIFAICVNTDSP